MPASVGGMVSQKKWMWRSPMFGVKLKTSYSTAYRPLAMVIPVIRACRPPGVGVGVGIGVADGVAIGLGDGVIASDGEAVGITATDGAGEGDGAPGAPPRKFDAMATAATTAAATSARPTGSRRRDRTPLALRAGAGATGTGG